MQVADSQRNSLSLVTTVDFDKQEESRKVKSDTEVILKLLKMLCELHYVA